MLSRAHTTASLGGVCDIGPQNWAGLSRIIHLWLMSSALQPELALDQVSVAWLVKSR